MGLISRVSSRTYSLIKMTLKLYSFYRSSASYRVRIVLNLMQKPYDYVAVNLLSGENYKPEYNQTNKMGQVPCLVHNDAKITQSLAIIDYLQNDLKDGTSVLKRSAKALEIAEIITSGIQPIQNVAVLRKIHAMGGNVSEWAQNAIEKGFNAIENHLNECSGLYCVGDEISIADVCLVPQVVNAIGYGVDLNKFPKICEINSRLRKLDAFIAAAPENQPDFSKEPIDVKKVMEMEN